ncbi:MAG: MerR family transcriptional regulator [Gaiellaceae bacterium]
MADSISIAPPFELGLLEKVASVGLYLGQVCQIAGISKAQLDYWTVKARIPTTGKKQRIYGFESLGLVMRIKQGVDSGLHLAIAIERSRERPVRGTLRPHVLG